MSYSQGGWRSQVPQGFKSPAGFAWGPKNRAEYTAARALNRPPGFDSNLPRDAIKVKSANWYYSPSEEAFGLGKYRKRAYGRKQKRKVGRSAIRRVKYTTRRKKAAKRRTTRRRTGRGGFADIMASLGGIGKEVGKAALGGIAQAGINRLDRWLSGGGKYSASGAQGVPTFGPGKYRHRQMRGLGEYESLTDAADQMGSSGMNALSSLPQDAVSPVQALDRAIRVKQEIPTIVNTPDGHVTVRHKEYVADIVSGGTAFTLIQNLQLNPGLNPENGGPFPWLSGIAQHFQQYRFNGLVFEFRSTSGTNATTQALGEVLMSSNYNVADLPPTNKQEMLSQVFAISRVPAADFEHPIECNPRQSVAGGLLYVRSGPIPVGQDARFYDFAETNIATQGQTSPVTLGELWVTYQVELYKPALPSVQSGASGNGDPAPGSGGRTFRWSNGALSGDVYTPVLTDIFGFASSRVSSKVYNSMGPGWNFGYLNSNQISFPPGIKGLYRCIIKMTTGSTGYGDARVNFSINKSYGISRAGGALSQYAAGIPPLASICWRTRQPYDNNLHPTGPETGAAGYYGPVDPIGTPSSTGEIGSISYEYYLNIDTTDFPPNVLGFVEFAVSASATDEHDNWPYLDISSNSDILIEEIPDVEIAAEEEWTT